MTFQLREDVIFHQTKYFTPTRKLNADDVIFFISQTIKKRSSLPPSHGGSYQYWESMGMSDLIKSIEKIDNFKIKISLNEPNAPFLSNLAMSFMSVLSKEYADQLSKRNEKEKIDHFPIEPPFVFKK